jgi:hypothetical protein
VHRFFDRCISRDRIVLIDALHCVADRSFDVLPMCPRWSLHCASCCALSCVCVWSFWSCTSVLRSALPLCTAVRTVLRCVLALRCVRLARGSPEAHARRCVARDGGARCALVAIYCSVLLYCRCAGVSGWRSPFMRLPCRQRPCCPRSPDVHSIYRVSGIALTRFGLP